MSKIEKLIEQMRANPQNVRPDDLDKLLTCLGYTGRMGGGSHKVYRRQGAMPITVPQRYPFLKAVYVKLVLDLLDEPES